MAQAQTTISQVQTAVTNERIADVIGFFYDAALQQGSWKIALEHLERLLGTDKLVIMGVNPKTQDYEPLDITGYKLDYSNEYQEKYLELAKRELKALMNEKATERQLNGEVSSYKYPSRMKDVYDLMLKPTVIYNSCAVLLSKKLNNMTYISLSLGKSENEFSANQLNLLSAVAPHVKRALELSYNFLNKPLTAPELIDTQNHKDAVFLLNDNGRVVFFNKAAREMINVDTVIYLKENFLQHADARENKRFEQSILKALKDNENGEPWFGDSIQLDGATRIEQYDIRLLPLNGGEAVLANSYQKQSVKLAAIIKVISKSSLNQEEILQERFELTRKEASIVYFLCEGLSVKEIAEKKNVSTNAIRFHLKNIFSKVGVKSQIDLVVKVFSQ